MNIRMKLAGIAALALAVVASAGVAAPQASAAPAAPASHSAVQQVQQVRQVQETQTTIPPKRPGSIDELYGCPLVSGGSSQVWDCNGTWYAGTPGSRTYQQDVTVLVDSANHESVGLQWLKSLDGRQKDVRVYCQNSNGSSSGLKGHYIVGGNYPNTNSLGGTGRFFCDGDVHGATVGYIMDIGASYGSGIWHTIITVGNWSIGGTSSQYGHPERTCAC